MWSVAHFTFATSMILCSVVPQAQAQRREIGSLPTLQHRVNGTLFAEGDHTFIVENFNYDGAATAVYIYVYEKGVTVSSSGGGIILQPQGAASDGRLTRSYTNEELVVRLADCTQCRAGLTIRDLQSFTVWSQVFGIFFSRRDIPADLFNQVGEDVLTPPSNLPSCVECLNGGTFLGDGCECLEGFSGVYCEVEATEPYIACDYSCNNGYCDYACGTCVCHPFATGEYCNETLITPCGDYYCLNGGECVEDAEGNSYCLCGEQFDGEYCQKQNETCLNGGFGCDNETIDDTDTCLGNYTECGDYYCFNGGVCLNGTCLCTDRFGGDYCLENTTECEANNDTVADNDCFQLVQLCGNGYCVYGDCVNGSCECFENTTGGYCDTVLAPTSPPVGFTFDPLNVSLSWQPPLGYEVLHEQYALWYYLLLEDLDRGVYSDRDTDLTSLLLEDLEPGTHYCVSVRAVTSGGFGVNSGKECFNTTTLAPPCFCLNGGYYNGSECVCVHNYFGAFCENASRIAPSAPLNLTFPPGGVLNDSITLTWSTPEDPSSGVRFYQLQQSSSGGDIFVNTTDNSTTMVLYNLSPGVQYNFSVRAFTIVFGPFSDQLSVHTADVPLMPQDVTATSSGSATISVTWREPVVFFPHDNSLTSYEVWYRGVATPNDVGGVFYEAVTVPVGMTLSYDILGLMAYSTYNVSVRATNQYGVGYFSEEVTVRTEEGAPSAPLNFTFPPGVVLNDSITLTWSTPQHPSGVIRFYQLQQSSFGGDIFINTTDNTTMEVLYNLSPGTQYNFSVRAFTVAFGPFSDQLSIHTADVPSVPHAVSAFSTGFTSVMVTWTDPAVFFPQDNSFTTYEVQYRGVATPNDVGGAFYEAVTVPAGMNVSYDIFGLMPHSTYAVSVRATNQYGVGDFSEEVTVRTEEGTPSAPLNLTFPPGGVTNDSITLSWSTPQRPSGVIQFYELQQISSDEDVRVNTTDNTTTLVLYNLSPGTQYNISVRAFTIFFGPFSDQLSLYTADVPLMPHNVSATSAGSTTISVTWREPVVFFPHDNSLTSYEVRYQGVATPNDVDEVFYKAITVPVGMNLSYNILGLMAYSTYNVSVRATNQYGVGEFSEEVTVRTEEEAPSAPLNLTFPPGGVLSNSITLTWLSPKDPNGVIRFYQLEQSSSGGDIFVNTTDSNTTSVLSDLAPNTQYNFSVRAFTGAGPGPFSEETSVTTLEDVPSAPLGLRETYIGPNGFNLEWNPPSSSNGIIHFYQVVLLTGNNLELPAVNISRTSYNVTGLAPFTGYSVQVCAFTIGCGDFATLNVTTLGVSPEVIPSDGVSSKPISMGDPATFSFTIVNVPVPPVTRERIQWMFIGSGGAVNLSCTSTSKYSFSEDCLNLTVNNTEGSDAGLYQITITTAAGIGISEVGISVSGVPPELVIPLMNITLAQGDSHMFVCAAVADPRPIFVFRFNGERITSNSSKHTLVTNNTHGTLTVFNLQGSDEGTYNCSASNRYGSVTTAAVLIVQVPPSLTFFPSAVRDVVRGETLVVSCRASADPPPVIQWFNGDQMLNDGNQSSANVSISSNTEDITTSSQLTVTQFTSEEIGTYSCMAVNDLGNDSRSFQVNVVVRPNITGITRSVNGIEEPALFHQEELSLDEFTPQLELTCEAYGNPQPEVVWLNNGIALQNISGRRTITVEDGGSLGELGNITRSTLSLSEVQLSDAGEYTCRAISGNVSPIPGTTAWTFTFEVTELIECDPNPCLNNGTCVDGVRNYTCNCTSFPEDGVLIYFAGRNCDKVVDNRVAPLVTTSPANQMVEINDRIVLSCTATGNPAPSIHWFKDNGPIAGPQAIGSEFVIPEATPNERGFYQCEAFSSFGPPSKSTEAVILIQGIVQFRIQIIFGTEGIPGSRRKRLASSNADIIENLQLQTVSQPLAVEGNYTATVYSVESAGNNSNDIIITVATDSSESPANLTDQLTQPLEQTLEEVTDINEQVSFAIVATERYDGCPRETDSLCGNVSTVTWPETEIGQVASVPCPCGVSDPLIQQLTGTRRCGGTFVTGAVWDPPQCDSCQFSSTRRTLCQLTEVDSPAQLANVLANVTNNTEEIESEDVSLTVGLLDTVTNSTEDLQQEEVQMDVLSVVSNVQQVPPAELVASQEQTQSSNRLLEIVEEVLNVVEVTPDDPFEFAAPEFGVRVEDPPVDLGEEDFFTPNIAALLSDIMSSTAGSLQMEEMPELPPAMVTLDSTLLSPDNNGSRPRISTSIYGRDSLFRQRNSFITNTNRQQERVGGIVLDLTLRSNGRVMSIFRPPNSNVVRPSFTKSTLARNQGSDTSCRFWNFTADDGFGAWDSSSCRVLSETEEEVECGCDHLTHFAILLDINPNPPPPNENTLALTGVSYIGSVLSIISLTITIITYIGEQKLRKIVHAKVLINLCFALVGLYVTFIISTVSTGVPVLCGVISALMHYFFLAVFFWMAAEAIYLHRKLVTVFKPDITSYVSIAMAICWVIPAFIVVFSLAPHYQNYIHTDYCRVHDYSFWIGLIIPFGIIYIMNWVIFIIIFTSLVTRPNAKKELETSSGGTLRKVKENFTIALGLSLLFGIGWALGLLASSDLPDAVRYPSEWIFTLATAFLGVYLFILYIVRCEEARMFWRKWLCPCWKIKGATPSTNTNTPSSTRWGTLSSTLRSWVGTLKPSHWRSSKGASVVSNSNLKQDLSASLSNQNSISSTAGRMVDINSSYAEPSSVLKSTARATSPCLPPVVIELVHRLDPEGQSNNKEASPQLVSPSELPVKVDIDARSIMETTSFHDNDTLQRSNSLSTQSPDPSLSSAEGDCYIVQNNEIEGADVIPL